MPTKYAAQAKYDAEHAVHLHFKLNSTTDVDILAWLDRQPAKQTAIKSLIRAAIAAEQTPDDPDE